MLEEEKKFYCLPDMVKIIVPYVYYKVNANHQHIQISTFQVGLERSSIEEEFLERTYRSRNYEQAAIKNSTSVIQHDCVHFPFIIYEN